MRIAPEVNRLISLSSLEKPAVLLSHNNVMRAVYGMFYGMGDVAFTKLKFDYGRPYVMEFEFLGGKWVPKVAQYLDEGWDAHAREGYSASGIVVGGALGTRFRMGFGDGLGVVSCVVAPACTGGVGMGKGSPIHCVKTSGAVAQLFVAGGGLEPS